MFKVNRKAKSFESPLVRPTQNDLPAFTGRTLKFLSFVRNGEYYRIALTLRLNIVITYKTESVVQKTRGHASPFDIGNLGRFPFLGSCPFFQHKKCA